MVAGFMDGSWLYGWYLALWIVADCFHIHAECEKQPGGAARVAVVPRN